MYSQFFCSFVQLLRITPTLILILKLNHITNLVTEKIPKVRKTFALLIAAFYTHKPVNFVIQRGKLQYSVVFRDFYGFSVRKANVLNRVGYAKKLGLHR